MMFSLALEVKTRNNITSHLYKALDRKSIKTFIDDQLPRGDEISSSLLETIKVSQISVIIFSENYAASRWCLQELEQILDCRGLNGQMVIPVFYHVDPSHVRKQTGSFGDAFAKLQDRFKDEMHGWKAALEDAGNLSGHVINKEKLESDLIEDIVNDILDKLEYLSSCYRKRLDHLVGAESRVEEIISTLGIKSDGVHVLGIWGIGGIGKTTICKAVCNKIQKQFDRYYFAEDVREKSERSEFTTLKKELFSALLDDHRPNIPDIRQSAFTQERLGRTKVLIVFDDVTCFEQIEKLIGHPKYLNSGSRIIITTRDKHVLENCKMNDANIYKVKGLRKCHALQLFSKYAFGKPSPPKDYEKLSDRLLLYAKGVPLALKVLGSFLRSRSEQEWESEMKKLDKCLDMEIRDVLKISYDGLDENDRKIFLDIACFFKGWESYIVKDILDASDFFTEIGLRNLIDKCLIEISYNNKITMHDLLQEMGRTIVRTECKDQSRYSRLWDHDDIYNVLRRNTGTKAVEGISLDISKISDIKLKHHAFAKMNNLRIFIVYNSHDQGDYQKKLLGFEELESFSRGLTFFSWERYSFKDYQNKLLGFEDLGSFSMELPCFSWEIYPFKDYQNKLLGFEDLESFSSELTCFIWERYPFKSLPPNFQAENLVILDMPGSKIKQLWNGVQNLVKLKHVDLSHSRDLTEVPNLSKAVNLQELILRDCESLISLPEGIQSKFITLQGCSMLIKVPKISCKVEHLDLSGTAIRESPVIEQPSKLVSLNLSNCLRLEILSDSIKKCKYLKYLYLQRYARPGRLLEDFGNLDTSDTLTSHGISKATPSIAKRIRYPEPVSWALNCISSFVKRRRLFDRQIMKLPKDLGQLSFLKRLNLSGNNFESMPASIKDLSNLYVLNISNCEKLISLPELPGGTNLVAYNCYSLESISNSSFLFSPACSSRNINFSSCFKLKFWENLHKETPQEFCKSVCYPGNEIPEWFEFQNIGSSITPELPPDWTNENLLGFNICTVVAFPECYKRTHNEAACFCTIKSKNHVIEVYSSRLVDKFEFCSTRYLFFHGPSHVGSDHVFMGSVYNMKKIVEMRAPREEVSESEVSFSFYFSNIKCGSIDVEIKKCGIHFLYNNGSYSGFMISNMKKEGERYFARPVKDIFEGFNKLCPTDNEDLAEIEIAIREIQSFLRRESPGVRVAGIWGMIGMDGATFDQVLNEKISTEFEISFFLYDAWGFLPSDFRCELLSKVLDDENINIEYCLKHKRVFIFDRYLWSPAQILELFGDLTRLSSSGQRLPLLPYAYKHMSLSYGGNVNRLGCTIYL